MTGVTIITPTGMRPQALKRCAYYIARFECPVEAEIQWIIVDDGAVPSPVPMTRPGIATLVISPQHTWKSGDNTLAQNLLAAIPHVLHENVLIVEDDDWYSPKYLMSQVTRLQTADIAGEIPSRYYHAPSRRYRIFENRYHASLCQTAMRISVLPSFTRVCQHSPSFIDTRLWEMTSLLRQTLQTTMHCIGIKGMQGRPGIGIGHTPDNSWGWRNDPQAEILDAWIGPDAVWYPPTGAYNVPA